MNVFIEVDEHEKQPFLLTVRHTLGGEPVEKPSRQNNRIPIRIDNMWNPEPAKSKDKRCGKGKF